MQSVFARSFLALSVLLALSACSKDQGAAAPPKQLLFKGRASVQLAEDFTVADADAIPTGLASNKNELLWASGNIKKSGTPDRAIVRKSDSYGGKGTWTIVSDSDGPTHEGANNNAIATDGNGNVYVAQTYNIGKLTVASILYSTDGGTTWKNADYDAPNVRSTLKSVTLSPNGVPYFTGESLSGDQGQTKQGFVLTLENGKATLLTALNNSELNQVAAKATGDYYVVGTDLTNQAAPNWFLFSGMNDGKDPNRDLDLPNIPRTGSPFLGSADVIMIMSVNNGPQVIYTGGTDKTPTQSASNWIIKKSTDGGANFAVVDPFHAHFTKNLSISALYSFNDLPFAVGGGQDANGNSHWIIRYAESYGTWRTMATFNQSTNPSILAKAVGIASIVNNNQLAVLGTSHDTSGYHWKVMRISEHGFSTKH